MISSVTPGSVLVLSEKKISTKNYWRPTLFSVNHSISDNGYIDQYKTLLDEVVRGYTLDQSRVGIALSGGLDSSTLAVSMLANGVNVEGFSYTTPDMPEADESHFVNNLAEKLDIPVHLVTAEKFWPLAGQNDLKTLPDAPFAMYYQRLWKSVLSSAVSSGHSKLFTGNAGDNLFGGHVTSFADLVCRGRLIELTRQVILMKKHKNHGVGSIIRTRILGSMLRAWSSKWNDVRKQIPAWLGPRAKDLANELLDSSAKTNWAMPDRCARLRELQDPWMSYSMHFINDLSAKEGVELCHPMMDHRLIDFSLSIPSEMTFNNGYNKFIMRKAMKGLLPEELLGMRNKIHPRPILNYATRNKESEKIRSMLTGLNLAELGYVDESKVLQSYLEHVNGTVVDNSFLSVLTLEDWFKRYHLN